MRTVLIAATLIAMQAGATEAPQEAELYIISPANGDIVDTPVRVQFGLRGMGVAPAGVEHPQTGHHHLLVNVDELPPLDQPLPVNGHVLHFGGGQTETLLDLPPGRHTLRLLLGDHNHVPHDPPLLSAPITVIVE